MPKRKCNACNSEVETDKDGNYTCGECGYDREAARAHIKKQQAIEREKKEMEDEAKKTSKKAAWTI